MVLDTDHLELTRKLRLVAVKKNVSRFKNCAQWGRSIPDVINFSDDVAYSKKRNERWKTKEAIFSSKYISFRVKNGGEGEWKKRRHD